MYNTNYGIRLSDGKMISIEDIPIEKYGLRCNCVCRHCGEALEACSLQGDVRPYFRHHSHKRTNGNNLICNNTNTNESDLHFMAKEIIKEEHKIFVPFQSVSPWEVNLKNLPDFVKAKITQWYEYRKAEEIEYCAPETEKLLQGFKPDVLVNTAYGQMIIEIVVTNDIKTEKKIKITKCGLPALKINLKDFVEKPIKREELRKILIEESDYKSWIYYPISDTTLNLAQQYYENSAEVKKYYLKMNIQNQNSANIKSQIQNAPLVNYLTEIDLSKKDLTNIVFYEDIKDIKDFNFSQDVQIRDKMWRRYLFCTTCKTIYLDVDMAWYRWAQGLCRECDHKNELQKRKNVSKQLI